MDNILTAILTALSSVVTTFGSVLTGAFEGVVGIFYDGTKGLTSVGYLLILAFAISLVFLAFKVVKGLVLRHK